MGANAIGILGGGFTLAEREATTMTHSGMRRMAAAAAAVLLLTAAAGLTGCKPKKTPASSEPGASGTVSSPASGGETAGASTDTTAAGGTTMTDEQGRPVTTRRPTPDSSGGNSGGDTSGGSVPTVPDTDKIIDKVWYQGTDISKNPLFNPDNVAPAINDTVKKMKAGDKAYLPYGRYKYTETIRIENASSGLKNCVIVLDGVYAQPKTSTFDAMTVAGENLSLTVNSITNNYLSNTYPTKRASGITVTKARNCTFTFGQITGFEYGIRLMPSKANIEGNTVSFRYLGDCKYPLYLEAAPGANASVNKTVFTGGRVRGYTGVTMKKGSAQTSPHTGNTFNTISWESIETTGIDAAYAANTTHIAPRFESVMGVNIREGAASSGSRYDNAVDLPMEKIELSSKNTVINMPVFRVDPSSEWQDVIKSMKTDAAGRVTYEFYEESFVEAKGSVTLGLNCANVAVSAGSSAVELKLHKLAAYNGAEIWLYISDASKGVSVKAADGSVVADASKFAKGTYKLTYTTSWKLEKVSSGGIL